MCEANDKEIVRADPAAQKRCGAPWFDLFAFPVPDEPLRILSDVHYGDRASRVRDLEQLHPLLDGISHVVFNGDTLDTRSGPRPQHTAACRAAVHDFTQQAKAPVTFLTGNHDPDLSTQHCLECANGQVLIVHGDVLFEDIVPWGRDARTIRRRIAAELGGIAPADVARIDLDTRLAIWRRVAASVDQRHQSERSPLKYAVRFAVDTVWPPTRFLEILRAWQTEPARAAALLSPHRPRAKFIILGHTHRPAIRPVPGGPIVINTGSFCAPLGGYAVDITDRTLRVRQVDSRGRAFHPGAVLAEFPLAKP